MRFFHLSDLHIGLKLMNHDLAEDQEHILAEIVRLAAERQPDAVVIAGDIYDKAVPSAEAVSRFDHFVTELARAVPQAEIMMISGNHDSADRVNVFRQVLARQHIHMIGRPPELPAETIAKVTLTDDYGPVNFYLLPFVKPSMVKLITGTDKDGNNFSYDEAVHRLILREKLAEQERNVLVSHQFYLSTGKDDTIERSQSEIVTVGNIDSVQGDILNRFDYAALGHIHKPQRLNGKDCYRYCGTPIACSFSEEGQQKGVIEVDLGAKGEVTTTVLPLVPLRQVRTIKDTLANVLAQPSGDYVSITLTDADDYLAFDMRDRLDACFPHLLHVGRERTEAAGYRLEQGEAVQLSPFELCRNFLQDLDEEEEALLAAVINEVQEAEK
ncbi:Exodeoxyribonuclease I subunit D [Selenomonas sp. GACV-9]|uniref:exonuclease SbcCD subunit D n=1 Tax=Selenomonas sp. GACV-9 TaxID=3158782 RepID=UPI0008EA2ADA|nr:Exodeoxyribonuclease I subunit D [Selenomonas ruminantium]